MFPLGWGWGTGSPLPPGDKDSKDRDTQPVWGRLCPALPSLPPKARVECHRGIGDIVTVRGHCHCPRGGDVSLCRMCCCWVHGEGGGAGSLPWCRSWGVPGGPRGPLQLLLPPPAGPYRLELGLVILGQVTGLVHVGFVPGLRHQGLCWDPRLD